MNKAIEEYVTERVIQTAVETAVEADMPREKFISYIRNKFQLSEEEANKLYDKYLHS